MTEPMLPKRPGAAKNPLLHRTSSNFEEEDPFAKTETVVEPIPAGVWVVVFGQFCFYGVTIMMLPALYKHCQDQKWDHPERVFANALLAAAIGTFALSFVIGAIGDMFGEKRAYQVVVLVAALSAPVVTSATSSWGFIAAWATLKSVSEGLRGVKNAYMGKHAASHYNFVSNFALGSGLVSSALFPALGAILMQKYGDHEGLVMCGFFGAGLHVCLLMGVTFFMQASSTGQVKKSNALDKLPSEEIDIANFRGSGMSLSTFKTRVLTLMCLTTFCFQFAVNMTIMALFQPLMVKEFHWDSAQFSKLQSMMSTLGTAVTVLLIVLAKNKTITAAQQCMIGGAFFFLGIGFFVVPPVTRNALVAAQVLGFLSQIVFSGPWNVVLGQALTKDHVTSTQMSILGSMIAVGQSAGCAVAPSLLPYAGTWFFTVPIFPVFLGVLLMRAVTSRFLF